MVESSPNDRAKMGQQIKADFEKHISNINEANLLCTDANKDKKVYFSQDENLSML